MVRPNVGRIDVVKLNIILHVFQNFLCRFDSVAVLVWVALFGLILCLISLLTNIISFPLDLFNFNVNNSYFNCLVVKFVYLLVYSSDNNNNNNMLFL